MDRPDATSRRATESDAGEPPVGDGSGPGDDAHAASEPDAEASAWDDRLPSNEVALAIASREHVVVGELPPLFESVDTDALDKLIRGTPTSSATFTHCGYEVTVTGDGEVELTRLDEP